jgi:nucleotide-binding universal stress UspA family protein
MNAKEFGVRPDPGSAPATAPSTACELPSKISIKKILAALDFSDHSTAVLNYAMTLAGSFQAEIMLLHVFAPVPPDLKVLESVAVDPGFRQQAADELAQWRSRVPSGFVASAELRDGKHAYHEILAAAEQHNADLIVIGRSGHTGLERVLLGSNVDHVLKNACCPVFVTT